MVGRRQAAASEFGAGVGGKREKYQIVRGANKCLDFHSGRVGLGAAGANASANVIHRASE